MLADPALVLNQKWYPIGTTTVRDAICMIYRDAALALDPLDYRVHDFDSWAALAVAQDEPCIRTVHLRIRVPEIIVLTHYDQVPRRRVAFSRRNLYKRDRYRCQYCGDRPPVSELTIDHVLPRAAGGRSSWSNCVLACLRCNRRKAHRTPREAGMHLLRRPGAPDWSPCLSIPLVKRRASWEQFVSERYWNVELES